MELAHIRRVITWAVVGALAGIIVHLPDMWVLVVAVVTALIPEFTG